MEGEHHQLNHLATSGEAYRECLRNHAASLGSYATDGCGEFTPDDGAPGNALQCAACGCHRNFHRKVVAPPSFATPRGCYNASVESSPTEPAASGGRRRSRTKFSGEQKEKMLKFAVKLGWRMVRRELGEEADIDRFCAEVGISRQIFKVWMHNHKSASSTTSTPITGIAGSSILTQ